MIMTDKLQVYYNLWVNEIQTLQSLFCNMIPIYIYIHIVIYVYIHIYKQIHTHTHTFLFYHDSLIGYDVDEVYTPINGYIHML